MRPTVRIPLQVGTGSFAHSTGAVVGAAFTVILAAAGARHLLARTVGVSTILFALSALLMLAYTVSALRTARRTRASDVTVTTDGFGIVGGPRAGKTFAWNELAAPFATTTRTEERRAELAWILVGLPLSFAGSLLASAIVSHRGDLQIVRHVVVTRLRVRLRSGEEVLVAETDDPDEAASLEAARDTIAAVAEGRRVVEQAPHHAVRLVTCPTCGAPVVPADVPAVQCAHCSATVAMTEESRRLAASARETAAARSESHRLVATLLEQPDAASVDGKLRLLSIAQIVVWPVGWAVVAWRARSDGWMAPEVHHLFAPGIAVLALWFLALGAASERRALRTLTLGFGALAPLRPGAASRCRRCHAPLGVAAGIATCAHCGADNVVGIDLRAAVDAARNEQPTFDDVLDKRRQSRVSAIGLKIVAVIFVLFWLALLIGQLSPR